MIKCIVVLGGYGNFGSRIAAALAREPDTRVLIAGLDLVKATALAREIGGQTEACLLDHHREDFAAELKALGAIVLIHTAGPFQGQDYKVASACIEAGCHYVDIADGRRYVSSIGTLHEAATANNLLVVSGASSLPALSSAVVDQYRAEFSRLDTIEHAISSGAKPPGLATLQGVTSYVGKTIARWEQGQWRRVYGCQSVAAHRFPGAVGKRWLVNCDVPDLELFPQRYPEAQSVIFRAGVGMTSTMLALLALSWLVRLGVISSLERYAEALHNAAAFIEPLGTQWSAMTVQLTGVNHQGQLHRKAWYLLAGDNHGPNIPCFPAIALVRKLLRGEVSIRGAMPCMGLLTVAEILGAIPCLNLRVIEVA